jgi:hypothetical protein
VALTWRAPANMGERQVLHWPDIPMGLQGVIAPTAGGAKAIGTYFSSGLGAAMLRLLPGKTACGQTRLRQFLYV